MTEKSIQAALLVAVLVVSVAVAGLASAASAGSVSASPNDPDATATHTVTATIGSQTAGGSWTGFQVNYTDSDVSNVGQGDVVTIGIDRGDDESGTTIDVDASDDLGGVSASDNGHTLTFSLGGNYNLQEGDEVVVVYQDVQNPASTGDYTVSMDVNHQSSGGETSATLSITSDSETTTTTTTTTQSDDEETTEFNFDTTTTTTAATTTTTTTSSEDVNASGAYVDVHPEEPNVTATHEVTVTVGSETGGDSWNGLRINYSGTGTDISDVGQGDVVKIGIDRGDDESGTMIDVSVSEDLSSVSGSENGTVLTIGLGGNYNLQRGDEVVVVYQDVQNPSEDVYEVPVDVNPQSSGGTDVADMPVLGSIDFTTETTENTDTTTDTTAGGTTATATSTTTTESSPTAESPGFGTAMAVLALFAAAALLARR